MGGQEHCARAVNRRRRKLILPTNEMYADKSRPINATSLQHACRRVAAASTVRAVLDTLAHELRPLVDAKKTHVLFYSELLERPLEAEEATLSDQSTLKGPHQHSVQEALSQDESEVSGELLGSAPVVRSINWHELSIGTAHLWTTQPLSPAQEIEVESLLALAAIALWRAHRYEQMRDAKREWEQTFDGMLDGVCLCRVDGIVLRANRALANLTGRPVEQLIGLPHDRLFETALIPLLFSHEQSTLQTELAPASSFAGSQIREFRVPANSASENNSAPTDRVFVESILELQPSGAYELDAASTAASNGAQYVCTIREITEQRRLQEQLLQSEKLAALGELVSGVAHELNNPLTTVLGYAQLLETDEQLPAHLANSVRLIGQEAQRAAHIVGNLLAFARASQPEKMMLSIDEILVSALKLRAYQLASENIEVQAHMAPSLPPIWGDPVQLQQVFLNIINNAAQAMSEWRGGGILQIEASLIARGKSRIAGDALQICLVDNGPGIAPEHLRRVFDPFFTTKGVGRGTGLGLSISHGIIANHGGVLWVHSEPGQGAQFILELPLHDVSASASQTAVADDLSASENAAVSTSETDAKKILVIDDEEPVVMLITEILSLAGYQITAAYNGAEALALLHTQPFDLIISDVRMPAVGGPTFFEILQTTRPDVLPRVLFVTGDTVSPSTRSFLQQAARPVLAKPFSPDRLRQMVAQCLTESSS